MVPSTTGAAIAFLFFVTPGLLYELLAERSRPPVPGSTFREISRVGLLSVVCTSVSAATLAVVRGFRPRWVLDPGRWVRSGSVYVRNDYALIARTLAIEVLLACGAALLLYWLVIGRRASETRNDPNPVLWSITGGRGSTPKYRQNARLFALARTHGGDVYQGYFVAIDLDADRAHPMLALQPPIQFQRDGQQAGAMPAEWDRLALPLADIQELWLNWVAAEPSAPTKA